MIRRMGKLVKKWEKPIGYHISHTPGIIASLNWLWVIEIGTSESASGHDAVLVSRMGLHPAGGFQHAAQMPNTHVVGSRCTTTGRSVQARDAT